MTAEQAGAREPARVVVDVAGYTRPDLVLVDLLARLRLVTGRLGAVLVVVGGSPDLEHILMLAGLLAVVPLTDPDGSERGRQSETLEQPWVEEVVDVADPPVVQLEYLDGPRREPPAAPGLVLGEGG
jgi:anti-anti-sigma regulatory factor